MRAAITKTAPQAGPFVMSVEERPVPSAGPGESLLRVIACALCRIDLHIVDQELPPRKTPLIPGHQIVAEVVTSSSEEYRPGDRVGVCWLGGTDGNCKFCRTGRENLCDQADYTGYTRDGGFAEFVVARTDFLLPLPRSLDALRAAPLLCAGVIGFRSLRVAEVKPGQRVGLYGFGASASLAIQVLRHWGCETYVATRGASHRMEAEQLGAAWVGDAFSAPPKRLDAAITFAPAGAVVLAALRSLDKGGIVAINAIHLDGMPAFDYDSLLWQERQIRSVANMTRQDGRDFLDLAAKIGIVAKVKTFGLAELPHAIASARAEEVSGTAVIIPEHRP